LPWFFQQIKRERNKMYTDYMDLLYIEFEGQEIMPTAMDVETYLRYIDSLGIKRFDDDILIIDKIRKHKIGHKKQKTQKENPSK
jgi:hypothetical protein